MAALASARVLGGRFETRPDFVSLKIFHRAGMRLFLSDADLDQHVENRLALDFQFPGQIVDSNLAHPPFPCSHRSLSLHRTLTESALHSLPALARAAWLIRFTVLAQRSRLPLHSPLQEHLPRRGLRPSRRSLLIPDCHLRLAPLKPLLLRPQTLPGTALPLRGPMLRLRHHRVQRSNY